MKHFIQFFSSPNNPNKGEYLVTESDCLNIGDTKTKAYVKLGQTVNPQSNNQETGVWATTYQIHTVSHGLPKKTAHKLAKKLNENLKEKNLFVSSNNFHVTIFEEVHEDKINWIKYTWNPIKVKELQDPYEVSFEGQPMWVTGHIVDKNGIGFWIGGNTEKWIQNRSDRDWMAPHTQWFKSHWEGENPNWKNSLKVRQQ